MVDANTYKRYFDMGYIPTAVFPEEYVLMVNQKTGNCVRIYINGSVWINDGTGYVQENSNG